MRQVIFDQKWLKNAPNLELYYMYRGMARSEKDKQKIAAAGLRYDITIIPARMLGCEFVKTAGHEHPLATGQNSSFAEIYEVLAGEAIYLMQKSTALSLRGGGRQPDDVAISREEASGRRPATNRLKITTEDVYAVFASTGDKVIIPPNYGHITINAGHKDLVMANWVADGFQSDYNLFRKKHGACYYCLSLRESEATEAVPGHKQLTWQPNPNYGPLPKLRFSQATNFSELGLDKNKPMYGLVSELSLLDLLKKPQDFKSLWQKIVAF